MDFKTKIELKKVTTELVNRVNYFNRSNTYDNRLKWTPDRELELFNSEGTKVAEVAFDFYLLGYARLSVTDLNNLAKLTGVYHDFVNLGGL